MTFLFHSEAVDYDYIDNKKNDTVLFLHGWGGDKYSFIILYPYLRKNFNILSITLPTIKQTNLVFTLDDYASIVNSVLKIHNIEKIIVICHSFGLRVACLLKQKNKIKKIIITGGAGIKNCNFFRKICLNNIIILSKTSKNQTFLKNLSKTDYSTLPPINKKTFQNIINFNLKNLLIFDCPTLLFWGKFDEETPLNDAKFIQKINSAKLVISKHSHFAYIEDKDNFIHTVGEFIYDNN